MKLAAFLLALCPVAAFAADDPIRFGEMHDHKIVPTRTIKACPMKTGYYYGFAIDLPAGTHNVRDDLQWPAPPGNPNAGVSSRHVSSDFGNHSGHFQKLYSFDEDDLPGAWKLTIYVDGRQAAVFDYTVVKAAHCP